MLQEILYRYVGMRRPDLAVEVYDLFVGLSSVVFPVTLADTDRARELVREGAPASMRDLVHAAVMLNNDLTSIATFDGGLDHVPGVQRFPWTAVSSSTPRREGCPRSGRHTGPGGPSRHRNRSRRGRQHPRSAWPGRGR